MAKLYTIHVHPTIGGEYCYQCVKCDYWTDKKHLILGHLASEHLPKRSKRKTSICLVCGLTVEGCKKLGECSEGKKKSGKDIKKILDISGIIP